MDKSIENNPKWKKQQQILKKQQFNFELMPTVYRELRIDAAEKGDSPNNVIRSVLGLKVTPPVRPRVGISLTSDEINTLAQQFDVDPNDRRSLLKKATEAIQRHYQQQQDKI